MSRKPAAKSPAPAGLVPACVAALAIFFFGLFSAESGDSDFWWHLKTGEYVVQNHRLPVPDPFSFTTAGAGEAYPGEATTRRFNLTHEWLAQATMYLAWRAGGFPAVVFFRAILLVAVCLLAGWIAARRTNSPWWGIAAALAAATVIAEVAVDRPVIVSYLMMLAFIAILETRRALWVLPVLALVWANCHGGFFLGWVVCGAYCVEAILRKDPDSRRLLLVSAGVLLLSGVNPNGFNIVPTLLRYRQSYLTSNIREWHSPALWGKPYGFNVLLYASIPVMALAWRRVRVADWLLYGFLTFASLTAVRNAPLFALFASILIATYFRWKMPLTATLQYAVTGLVAAGAVWAAVRGAGFQFRSGEWRFPGGASAFLREHRITAPLFNTYILGGYLVWKDHKTFVDGRALSESVFKDYETILNSPAGGHQRPELLAKYGVGAILMDSFEYMSGTPHELARAIAYPNMADWKLVYEDTQAMVFLRDVPAGMPVLGKERIADHLERECKAFVENVSGYPDCARRLGQLVVRTNPARARRMFALYFEHGGTDEETRRTYQQLP